MKKNRRNLFLALLVSLSSFIVNGTLFVFFYNHLATPFLHEEQRIENAAYIMSVVLWSFASASLLLGALLYLILERSSRT